MALAALPSGFYACFLGAVLGAGLALWLVWRLLRKARVLARARALPADASATTIVEFPFAMLTLVIITLLTWQLAFLTSAFLAVDWAAYAAVRSAIVVVPQDRGEDEGRNHIASVSMEPGDTSEKGEDIRGAAIFACVPISGTDGVSGAEGAALAALEKIQGLPGAGALTSALGPLAEVAARWGWAKQHVKVKFLTDVESGAKTFTGGEPMTVEVRQDFPLLVPFADRILGHQDGDAGYVTEIDARATMQAEGYDEQKPPGAPADAKP